MNEQQRNRIGDYIVWALLFLSTGAISGMFIAPEALQSGSSSASSNRFLELLMGLLYVVLLALLARHRQKAFRLLVEEKWMLLLALFVMASAFWSVDTGETFRRALGLLGTTLAGLYIGMRYEPRQVLRMLGICIGVAALLSLFVCLVFPQTGIMTDGSWQGVFYPKNSLGRIMCLGIFCYLFTSVGSRRRMMKAAPLLLLFAGLLLMSRSATALIVLLAMLLVFGMRKILYWPMPRFVAACLIFGLLAVPAAGWSMANMEKILGIFGRDPSVSGRLPLWHAVRAEIADRPLLGYGYAAFWTSGDADYWREKLSWDAPNAHNGFLDMALGIGVVGLGIFLLGLLRNVRLGFRIARESGRIEDAWPLFFLALCMIYDLSESTLFVGNSVFWLLYATNAYWLVRTDMQPVTEEEDETEAPGELSPDHPVGFKPA